ncbi:MULTISPECIES: hypothetical protein [unclassified Nocardia]|uniref:hypothetical protein n=1 Tax=unclassified Nocardia TaxID=2637762 RepID=UPI001CE47282|nr:MULTISPECIES: hypothetical protein [unclassified Nocardia]
MTRRFPRPITATPPHPRSGSIRTATRTAAVALLLGVLTAGTVAAAGISVAESSGRSHTSSTDPGLTDWSAHLSDPMGVNHVDSNPLLAQEHRNTLRDYHIRENRRPRADVLTTNPNADKTWTANTRPDGSAWTVCPALASWC